MVVLPVLRIDALTFVLIFLATANRCAIPLVGVGMLNGCSILEVSAGQP